MNMRYDQISPVPPLTKVTKFLIIICSVTFFVDLVLSSLGFQLGGYNLKEVFGLVPILVQESKWYWQFVTYIFLHGNALHILLNMLILWYFGAEIEIRMGERNFLKYFFMCGIGAGIFNYGVNVLLFDTSQLTNPIIGASGAIFGILTAYALFFGNRYLLVLFLFPMKAKYFVLIMGVLELAMALDKDVYSNVAHLCHIGGMFVGGLCLYFKYIRPRGFGGSGRRKDYEKEKLKRQFTLIVNEGDKENKDASGNRPDYWN